jgi:hypothetical protein
MSTGLRRRRSQRRKRGGRPVRPGAGCASGTGAGGRFGAGPPAPPTARSSPGRPGSSSSCPQGSCWSGSGPVPAACRAVSPAAASGGIAAHDRATGQPAGTRRDLVTAGGSRDDGGAVNRGLPGLAGTRKAGGGAGVAFSLEARFRGRALRRGMPGRWQSRLR